MDALASHPRPTGFELLTFGSEATGCRFLPAEEDERISLMLWGSRRRLRGFQPHLTLQIFHGFVPFGKGSVPLLCHQMPVRLFLAHTMKRRSASREAGLYRPNLTVKFLTNAR